MKKWAGDTEKEREREKNAAIGDTIDYSF